MAGEKPESISVVTFYKRAIETNKKRLAEAIAKNDLNAERDIKQRIADYTLKLANYERLESLVIRDTIEGLDASIMPPNTDRSLDEVFTSPALGVSREHVVVPEGDSLTKAVEIFRKQRPDSKNEQIMNAYANKKYETELHRIETLIGYIEKLIDLEDVDPLVTEIAERNIHLLQKMIYVLSTNKQEFERGKNSYFVINEPGINKDLGFLLRARLNHFEKKHEKLDQKEEKIKTKKADIVIHQPLHPTRIDRIKKKKIQKLDYKLARIKNKKGKVERKQRIIHEKKVNTKLHEFREMLFKMEKKLTPVENARKALENNTKRKNALLTRIGVLITKTGSIKVGQMKQFEDERKRIEAEMAQNRKRIEKKSTDFSQKSKFASKIANLPLYSKVNVIGMVPATEVKPELSKGISI